MSSSTMVRVILVAIAWVTLTAAPAWAQPPQEDPAQAVAAANSPASSLAALYDAAVRYDTSGRRDAAALEDALALFEFSAAEERSDRIRLASELIACLNRIGRFDPETLPASDPGASSYVLFPREDIAEHRALRSFPAISMTRGSDGRWRFDRRTLGSLGPLMGRLADRPAVNINARPLDPSVLGLRALIPTPLLEAPLLGVAWWQWIALLVIIFLGIALDYISRGMMRGALIRIEKRRGLDPDTEVIRRAVRPFGLLLAGLLWWLLLAQLDLPLTPLRVLRIALRVILMVAGVWASYRVVDIAGELLSARAKQTETKLDDLLIPLLRKTLKVFVTAFGLIYVAEALQIEILPLLTGLGIGGLALGLAAKDSIENFFGSVAVILDSPFEAGDWVVINNTEGTVEQIGLRSTRIRTFYNSLVSVPNATLVRAVVDNYGRRRFRRFKTMVALTYSTPPEKIEAFCEGVRELVRLHPYTRKDSYHVWLNKFGDHSLDVLVYIFHECPDWATELRERQRLMLDIIRLADTLGVEFAFPTRTIEFKNADTAPETPPLEIPARDSEMSSRRDGIQAARAVTEQQPWQDSQPGPVVMGTNDRRGSAEDDGGEG